MLAVRILFSFDICRLRARTSRSLPVAAVALFCAASGIAQNPPPPRVTLEQAIDFAVNHNHALLAARTQIPQSQAQETTAAIRPNPTLTLDSLFIPFTSATADNLNNITEYDA